MVHLVFQLVLTFFVLIPQEFVASNKLVAILNAISISIDGRVRMQEVKAKSFHMGLGAFDAETATKIYYFAGITWQQMPPR